MHEGDTRTRILDTAQELIERLGANAMSYQHISDAVGIRKASIHHHFPTKEALIEALLDRYNDYFLGVVDDIVVRGASPKEQLVQYIALFEASLSAGSKDKACLCGMLGAELASLGDQSVEKVRRFYVENEKRLAEILEKGRATGELRFAGDVRDAAALVFSLLEGAVLIARAHGGAAQFDAITRQLLLLLGA